MKDFWTLPRFSMCLSAGNFAKGGASYNGSMRVFRVIMNYEYLWQNIRVKGGAYGCSTNIGRNGDVCFLSYRDPNLGRTLDVYRGVPEYLKNFEIDERGMTRFVIGAFSELDAPLTPLSQGRRSLLSYLTGVTYEMIQEERQAGTAHTSAGYQRSCRCYADSIGSQLYLCHRK